MSSVVRFAATAALFAHVAGHGVLVTPTPRANQINAQGIKVRRRL